LRKRAYDRDRAYYSLTGDTATVADVIADRLEHAPLDALAANEDEIGVSTLHGKIEAFRADLRDAPDHA